MRLAALTVLACPVCEQKLHPLQPSSVEIVEGTLVCATGAHRFLIRNGIPELVRPERIASVEAFATSLSLAWIRDGWGSTEEEYLMKIPARDVTHRRSAEWKVKERSEQALLFLVDSLKPRRVVDLGSGVGWLARDLAIRGLEVFALDASMNDHVGLLASNVYIRRGAYFERVCGEIDRPPFLDDSVDMVVCNASLHYAPSLDTALREIARMLRADGTCVIMNSPVHRDERSARKAEKSFRTHLRAMGASDRVVESFHHFTRSALDESVRKFVGPVTEIAYESGVGFRLTRLLKGILLRMELASFPILYARRR